MFVFKGTGLFCTYLELNRSKTQTPKCSVLFSEMGGVRNGVRSGVGGGLRISRQRRHRPLYNLRPQWRTSSRFPGPATNQLQATS